MARKRRKFTKEYKSEVVKLVKEGGKTVSSVCADLDLNQSVVGSWVRQFETDEALSANVNETATLTKFSVEGRAWNST